MLKLSAELQTVTPTVSSGSWLFASDMDFLRMESKPFCFHETEGANNHIQQSDTFIFARNPVRVTYNRLPAMLTNAIHIFLEGARNMPSEIIVKLRRMRTVCGLQRKCFG
jgi:hypothetical protein